MGRLGRPRRRRRRSPAVTDACPTPQGSGARFALAMRPHAKHRIKKL